MHKVQFSFSLFMYILTANLFMVHSPLIHIYIFKEKQKLPSSHDQDWTAKRCSVFETKNKTPTSQLAHKQVGWPHGQSSVKTLGWESKWKLCQRGQRGCVVHSVLLPKEMILLVLALTGPECICVLPQRCGLIMGYHIVLLLHLYALKDGPLSRQMNLKTQFTCDNDTQGFSGYFQKNLNI